MQLAISKIDSRDRLKGCGGGGSNPIGYCGGKVVVYFIFFNFQILGTNLEMKNVCSQTLGRCLSASHCEPSVCLANRRMSVSYAHFQTGMSEPTPL